ncbi:MAG TPA: hypothetical protein VFL47_07055 [Flavisolibacter sp.]|nr:hypothetical protein [Flavisolibacter sp.]
MISLKKIFFSNPCLLSVSKTEKELLECFLENKAEFDRWISFHANQRIRFQFYYPTAIDFYFDEHRMFTAYFRRGIFDLPELHEFKMSRENYSSIRSFNWQPFQEVMRNFLAALAEDNKAVSFRQSKSLHDYAALCKEAPKTKEGQSQAVGQNTIFANPLQQ